MLNNLRAKTSREHFLALSWLGGLLVTLRFILASSVLGQTDSPFSGTVTKRDGEPIAGVTVYGSRGKTCCPFKREQTITDKEGRFSLEHPGAVIHFTKDALFTRDAYQPQAFVVKPGTSGARIVLEPSTNSLEVISKPSVRRS